MLSLAARLELLEEHLLARPVKTFVYRDLPFAMLRYDPDDEWNLRCRLQAMAGRLAEGGRRVVWVSLAELMWQAVRETEGIEALVELEQDRGFEAAQRQLTVYLTSERFRPLPGLLADRLAPLDPERQAAFVVRAAALSPAVFPISMLLSQMMGRVRVPSVLFYPGTLEGESGLCYMGLSEREAMGSYRVKIYS